MDREVIEKSLTFLECSLEEAEFPEPTQRFYQLADSVSRWHYTDRPVSESLAKAQVYVEEMRAALFSTAD